MTYSGLALVAVLLALLIDLLVLRTRMVTRRVFWVSEAIIVFFQLLSNGMFTGCGIVKYSDGAIVGSASPATGPPPFIGDGRLVFAPVEDLLFGFALVLLALSVWIWLGRRGVQDTPLAGPPRWRRRTAEKGGPDPRESTASARDDG